MEVRTKVNTLSMVEARDQLTHLPEQFTQELEKHSSATAIKVTRRNKPVLAILPWELYESIMETLEILSDEEQMTELRQGLLQETEGKGKSWKTVKKELGWETPDEEQPLRAQDSKKQKV